MGIADCLAGQVTDFHLFFKVNKKVASNMKLGLGFLALTAAQQGCIQKCTQTLGSDVTKCEQDSKTLADFVKCFDTAAVNWGNCLDACKPDPCNNKCTQTFDAAVNKCENSNLAPKDELQCISDAMKALRECREKCKSE